MASNGTTENKMHDSEAGAGSTDRHDFESATKHMSHEEKNAAARAARFGYGPLAHMRSQADAMLPCKRLHSFMLICEH